MCDPAGILFYGSIHALVHRSLEQFLLEMDISWNDWFHKDRGAPMRHVIADYQKPLVAGRFYDIHLSLIQLGKSSIHFNYKVTSKLGLHCDVNNIHAYVQRKPFQKINIPDAIRLKLEKAFQL